MTPSHPKGTGEQALLPAPPYRSHRCFTCTGTGRVRLSAVHYPRECPTCRGGGIAYDDRFTDALDRRAYQLGLAPVVATQEQPHD